MENVLLFKIISEIKSIKSIIREKLANVRKKYIKTNKFTRDDIRKLIWGCLSQKSGNNQ